MNPLCGSANGDLRLTILALQYYHVLDPLGYDSRLRPLCDGFPHLIGDVEDVVLLLYHVYPLPHLCPVLTRLLVLNEVLLRDEGLLVHGVVTNVLPFQDASTLHQLHPESLHCLFVVLLGGADEAVVADIRLRKECLEVVTVVVAEVEGLLPGFKGLLLDLHAVLIRTRAEEHLVPTQPVVPRHRVAQDSTVQVANVRLRVDVEDGRGDHYTTLREVSLMEE